MLEEVEIGKRGAKRRLSRRGRKYIYGIALAILPIVTAMGIITEELAVLYATLLGSILVPWLGLVDSKRHEEQERQSYSDGLDDGYNAATGNDEGEQWRS